MNVTHLSPAHLEEKLSAPQVLSQDVQHPDHLGEDEDSVASLFQPHQQFIQQNQLPTAADKVLSGGNRLLLSSCECESVQETLQSYMSPVQRREERDYANTPEGLQLC